MKNNRKIRLEDINSEWVKNNILANKNIFYLLFKNLADIFFGIVGFIFFILLFPFIGILIKLDSAGSILFLQPRFGKNKKEFILYKFRTMQENGREQLDLWREKNKNNITRVGAFLRKTHLDELPQAINLLKGDISFIGPRAEWTELAKNFETEIPHYKTRYLVKPGMMGWAQINFKASQSVEEAKKKFEYDLYYIKNQSILLDLEIILKSPKLFLQ